MTAREIKDIFGDTVERDIPVEELLNLVNRKYEVFHLVLESFGHKEIKDVVSPLSPDCFYTSIGNTRQYIVEAPLKTHSKSQ